MVKVLVVHGPNLNMLGIRQPDVYGKETLTSLNAKLIKKGQVFGLDLSIVQSNSEEKIIDAIHASVKSSISYIIINPAAFTHTSIAIRDALLSVNMPFIEVHITNIYARELFRQNSYFSDIALGVISGFGINSYFLALEAIANLSKRESL